MVHFTSLIIKAKDQRNIFEYIYLLQEVKLWFDTLHSIEKY